MSVLQELPLPSSRTEALVSDEFPELLCLGRGDPRRELGHDAGQELPRFVSRQASVRGEQISRMADIGFGLLQGRPVEEDERLAQMVIGTEAADRARRDTDYRRRLSAPYASPIRAGPHVERVPQDAGYRAVISRRREQHRVARRDRHPNVSQAGGVRPSPSRSSL
jgi:hypothetical protein